MPIALHASDHLHARPAGSAADIHTTNNLAARPASDTAYPTTCFFPSNTTSSPCLDTLQHYRRTKVQIPHASRLIYHPSPLVDDDGRRRTTSSTVQCSTEQHTIEIPYRAVQSASPFMTRCLHQAATEPASSRHHDPPSPAPSASPLVTVHDHIACVQFLWVPVAAGRWPMPCDNYAIAIRRR